MAVPGLAPVQGYPHDSNVQGEAMRGVPSDGKPVAGHVVLEPRDIEPADPRARPQQATNARFQRRLSKDRVKHGGGVAEPEESPSQLELARQGMPGVSRLMGKAKRNHITGEVKVPRMKGYPDFLVVDLWRRRRLPPTLQQLEADPYLFRPVALHYRTWLYQSEVAATPVTPDQDECQVLRQAFSRFCIDRNISAGRWSSLQCFGPLSLAMSLTGDMWMVLISILVVVLLYVISHLCNNVNLYRLERAVSICLRIPYLILLFVRFSTSDPLAVVGQVLTILACLADIILGDLNVLSCTRLHCTYEIMKELPCRVFVCARHGAIDLDLDLQYGPVDEKICGFSPWKPSYLLIADIGGLLFELRPMLPRDWRRAWERYTATQTALPYLNIEAFGPPLTEESYWDALLSSTTKGSDLKVEDF